MSYYEQMKKDFPTMYLRLMRNDSKVRCVAAGPATKEARSTENVLADFAELAEEAGMHEVADELHEAAAEVKPAKKPRAKKNDPDNFPM